MWSYQLSVLILNGFFFGAASSAEDLAFPPGFKFGVATAAYQIEGGWNVSDKSESIWDHVTHTHPHYIKSQTSGDMACDSYYNWRKDVEMVVELGVHFYRFSISWTRLVPQGITSHISEDGKNYYNNLIDGLLEKGIEPVVTLFHWDLPQSLQNLGGWTNPLIVDWFGHYARVVFSLYGDRVKTWITVNEPLVMCDMAYSMDDVAPAIVDDIAPYFCNKHVVLAHAKAYRIYDEEFRKKKKYHGRVSLASQLMWIEPIKEQDEPLAELTRLYMASSSHPIFSKAGGWPSAVEKIIAENSTKMGYLQSRLPAFSQAEIEYVRGTYDFYALNYYTSRLVRQGRPGDHFKYWPFGDCRELNAMYEYHPAWNKTSVGWLYMNPQGIRKQLAWLKKQYGDINFFITENGFPSTRSTLNDVERIDYYKQHLKQLLLSINEDKVNVTAYTAWSLMDNFEWQDGYAIKFGLYEVDSSPQRKRTARASAKYYASVIAAHSLDVPEVVFETIVDEAIRSDGISTNTWLTVLVVMAVIAAAAVALAAYLWIRRARSPNVATSQTPAYVTVKTDADYTK